MRDIMWGDALLGLPTNATGKRRIKASHLMTHISEAERIVKLMLLVRESGPIDLASIRRALPYEYGEHAGSEDSTRRRFERDKKTLQGSGVFLSIDDQQRYTLDASRTLAAPLNLTKPQVSLLRLLCGALLEDDGYPFKEELRMVLVKLGDELEIPDMLPQLIESEGRNSARAYEPQGFAKVKKAITTRKRLSFDYVNSAGKKSRRDVEPMGCFFLRGICYVAAFDPSVDSDRLFRLDRMGKLRVNGTNPKTPDFEERPFDASSYYGLPFQFGDEQFTARIIFDGQAAPNVQQLTMEQGQLTWEDDHLIWTVSCRDEQALARWCIENGPGIEIAEPAAAHNALVAGVERYMHAMSGEVCHEG